jgi:exopolyphosphatase / guanosine-5'-triphosphate,3'-diphosphate pyrophosphatase
LPAPKARISKSWTAFSKAVELGTGLESTGMLSYRPMQRTLQALRICRSKLERHNIAKMRLVATEACRRARNSREFLRRAQAETGLRLDIITAEEEARLAVVSCASLVAADTEQLLVIDIGGGSTELVWIDLSRVAPDKRRPRSWACIAARSTATRFRASRR